MPKSARRIIAFAVLSGSALFAQDLTGTWQGTYQASKELRVLFNVSKAANGLRAVMFNIDTFAQSPIGAPASAFTVDGSAVKILIPGVGGTYDGKLSEDGKSIAGTWAQNSGTSCPVCDAKPHPLNLTLATGDAAWTIPETPTRMKADADPAFEVSVIKLTNNPRPGRGIGWQIKGTRLFLYGMSGSDLVAFAYGVHFDQIKGGPAWFETQKYDVEGQPDQPGRPSEPQWKLMVQKLLADRFQLTFHREKKEMSVYTLTVSKTGAKLTPSAGDPNGIPVGTGRGLGDMASKNTSMKDLATQMQSAVLDRPVLDQTGLAGRFDFALRWTPDQFQYTSLGITVPPPADDASAPDLFTAIQQQLGLRLDSTKALADVIVVDRVEKPSEN